MIAAMDSISMEDKAMLLWASMIIVVLGVLAVRKMYESGGNKL